MTFLHWYTNPVVWLEEFDLACRELGYGSVRRALARRRILWWLDTWLAHEPSIPPLNILASLRAGVPVPNLTYWRQK